MVNKHSVQPVILVEIIFGVSQALNDARKEMHFQLRNEVLEESVRLPNGGGRLKDGKLTVQYGSASWGSLEKKAMLTGQFWLFPMTYCLSGESSGSHSVCAIGGSDSLLSALGLAPSDDA
jgi:hypothetical protein